MAAFAINPPSAPVVGSDGRVTSEWYRWFSRVQGVVGEDVVAQMQAAPVLTYSPTTAFANDKVLTAGAGMSFTSAAATFTIALAASGVTAATYGSTSQVSQIAVDQYGRITSASNVTITPATIGAAAASLTLTAGAGLTGGGDLSSNRTFDVGAGTGITVNANDVALDTTSTRNTDHAGVTLTAGAGLTGGGDITANRSFAVGAGTGITVNADDVALDTASNRNIDHSAVSVISGAGLTGGGTISADRTLSVGAGTGITVNADSLEVDTSVVVTLTGTQTLTNKTATAPIMNATPSSEWGIDFAPGTSNGSYVSIANNGTYDLAVGSGMVFLWENAGNGVAQVALYYGQTAIIWQNAALYSTAAGTAGKVNVYYNGTTAYRIQNLTGATVNIYVSTLRLRDSS